MKGNNETTVRQLIMICIVHKLVLFQGMRYSTRTRTLLWSPTLAWWNL